MKESKRTHRFSVTLSFAPKRLSDRTFHLSAVWWALERHASPLWFFHLYILSSATTAFSTLCQGRLYPHIYIYIYIYIHTYIHAYIHTYIYIIIYILHTPLYTFHMVMKSRIFWTMESFFSGWLFPAPS